MTDEEIEKREDEAYAFAQEMGMNVTASYRSDTGVSFTFTKKKTKAERDGMMTNEQTAIMLQHIEKRLRREISEIESQLPDEMREKVKPLPEGDLLRPSQNLNAEYYPVLSGIKHLADDFSSQIDLLTRK